MKLAFIHTVLLLCCLLTLLCGDGLWAQKRVPSGGFHVPSAPPLPDLSNLERYKPFDKTPLKFTSRAYYVLVPVIVRSKDGKHVPGLMKDSFEIFENGKPQKVVSMDEITTNIKPVHHSPNAPNEFSNDTSTIGGDRRITVVALDLVNTPFLDQSVARAAIIKHLAENATPESLYQLITLESNGMHVVHDFTADTEVLLAALKNVTSKFSRTQLIKRDMIAQSSAQPENVDEAGRGTISPIRYVNVGGSRFIDIESTELLAMARAEKNYGDYHQGLAVVDTLQAFQQIALRLYAVPGRKSLLWITGSFPFRIDVGTAAITEGISWDSYLRAIQLLNNANIALYPVDARGLVVAGELDASVHLTRQGNASLASYLAGDSQAHRDTLDTMRMFASMTGGKAYFNRNDLANAIKEAIDDGSAYYMLSYALDKRNSKPGWRKLMVTVKQPDVHVRAREGYFVSQTVLDPSRTEALDVANALNSPLDYTGIPLQVKLDVPSQAGDKKKVGLSLFVPANAAMVDDADNNRLSFEVWYSVRDDKGKDVAHKNQIYNLNLNPTMLAQLQSSGIGYNDTVELPPGQYNLRVVVRDNIAGKVGSVWASLKFD